MNWTEQMYLTLGFMYFEVFVTHDVCKSSI